MKLWLLVPLPDVIDRGNDNPWEPWYDKVFNFVVRASTGEQARALAADQAGMEEYCRDGNPWLNPSYTHCEELGASGAAGVIIRDLR